MRHSCVTSPHVCHRMDGVPKLIACLKDSDSDVRKFAAFAIGNLLYHSDYFYLRV